MNHLAWVASVAPPDTLEDNMNRSMLIGTVSSLIWVLKLVENYFLSQKIARSAF
jgi:hypothetical protein